MDQKDAPSWSTRFLSMFGNNSQREHTDESADNRKISESKEQRQPTVSQINDNRGAVNSQNNDIDEAIRRNAASFSSSGSSMATVASSFQSISLGETVRQNFARKIQNNRTRITNQSQNDRHDMLLPQRVNNEASSSVLQQKIGATNSREATSSFRPSTGYRNQRGSEMPPNLRQQASSGQSETLGKRLNSLTDSQKNGKTNPNQRSEPTNPNRNRNRWSDNQGKRNDQSNDRKSRDKDNKQHQGNQRRASSSQMLQQGDTYSHENSEQPCNTTRSRRNACNASQSNGQASRNLNRKQQFRNTEKPVVANSSGNVQKQGRSYGNQSDQRSQNHGRDDKGQNSGNGNFHRRRNENHQT